MFDFASHVKRDDQDFFFDKFPDENQAFCTVIVHANLSIFLILLIAILSNLKKKIFFTKNDYIIFDT